MSSSHASGITVVHLFPLAPPHEALSETCPQAAAAARDKVCGELAASLPKVCLQMGEAKGVVDAFTGFSTK
ncbi:hypothetical protein AB0F44_06440 [Nocardioides sp. NPDC023903]|uniref:hypothetical protein n=1 Tax=Nocardioides sp. NPDC023903 TaxID=3157195 RepID=UPI0033C3B645